MPFGAIFGTLFYSLLALWLLVTVRDAGSVSHATAQVGLALAASGIAGGLLLRRVWARWAGVAVAALLAALALRGGTVDDAAIGLAVLFGAAVVLALLVIPATGDVARGSVRERPAGALGRALAGSLVVGLIGVTLGLGWSGTSGGDARSEARPASLGTLERVAWSDFGAGLQRARTEGKPILVSFETAWCGYCRRMNKETWAHPEVVERLGEIVAVRVDAEEMRERDGFVGRELAERYGIRGFPSILLLDTDGRVVNRTGGFQSPRQFLSWLEDSLRRVGYEESRGASGA